MAIQIKADQIGASQIITAKINNDAVTADKINLGSGDYDFSGGTATLSVIAPTAGSHAATKTYVDSVAQGLDLKESCAWASTANLAATYNNGSSGVGATLTASANGAFTPDGTAVTAGQRILMKDQSAGAQNGIYTVTTVGSGGAAAVLTRATDFDAAADMDKGSFVFVEQGTANADSGFVMTQDAAITVGTTAITWSQFSGAGQITAGNGLAKSGNTLSVNVDGSSLEINADALRVKASGITDAMLAGSISAGKLAGSIGNDKLSNSSVSYGGVSLALGASDATPAFDLTDATNYPTSSLTGTITNAQLAGSIANGKLANSSVSFGGISVALGAADATPAFDLADATNYPTSSLVGAITNAQLAGSIANSKLANSTISGVALGSALSSLSVDDSSIEYSSGSAFNGSAASAIRVKASGITDAMLAGSISAGKLAGSLPDSLLNQITTADKVAGSAVELGSDSGIGNDSGLMLKPSVAGDGLAYVASGGNQVLSVGVDDSSIELDSDALRVKASGVTNAMLAGSIANAKLANSTISGASLGGTLASLSVDDSSIEYSVGAAYNGSAGSTVRIKALGVATSMIANDAVTLAKCGFLPKQDVFAGSAFDGSNQKNLATAITDSAFYPGVMVFRNGLMIEQKASSPSGLDEYSLDANGSDTRLTLGGNPDDASVFIVRYLA